MKYLKLDDLNIKRIFCIGRNYAAHARELESEIPSQPVIFMKPSSCLVKEGTKIPFPQHGEVLHQEAELVILIGKEGRANDQKQAESFIRGLSLGLDLTLRDVQDDLKDKGLPWEISKSFDYSTPIGGFITYDESIDLKSITFTCTINDRIRQNGNTARMLFSVPELILAVSKIWKLYPGDLIYTGTPAGVGPINPGDRITISGELFGSFSWQLV